MGTAARRAGWAPHIVGFSASEASRQKALSMGVIDEAVDSIAQAVTDADVVLLAVPVKATAACFQAIAPALKSDALLMDVGSTKADIVAAALETLGHKLHCFVPVHPIAGKEVAGIEHSDADLYQDRALIITPPAECIVASTFSSGRILTPSGRAPRRVTSSSPISSPVSGWPAGAGAVGACGSRAAPGTRAPPTSPGGLVPPAHCSARGPGRP